MVFFFKQKTAYEMRISDWSSDVCSSDLMLTVSEALDRAQMLCDAAAKAGADAADALYYCNAATSVSMRPGALEDVERSEGQDISLRVFVGQRSASVSTAALEAGEPAKDRERVV